VEVCIFEGVGHFEHKFQVEVGIVRQRLLDVLVPEN